MADYVAVMYFGRIVEYGTTVDIFRNPQHPYTVGLLESIPVLGRRKEILVPIERASCPTRPPRSPAAPSRTAARM